MDDALKALSRVTRPGAAEGAYLRLEILIRSLCKKDCPDFRTSIWSYFGRFQKLVVTAGFLRVELGPDLLCETQDGP